MEDDSHPLDYYPDEETGDEAADSLVLIDKARAALAQAQTLSDIGAVREIAERARRYASAAKLGREAENHAARLRIEAERRAGQLLAESPKRDGGDAMRARSGHPTEAPPKLSDLGISKQQSSDWQRIARVPEAVFEAHVHETTHAGKPLTTEGVVQVARQIEREQRRAEPKPAPDLASVPASVRCEVADAAAMPLERDSVHLIVTSPPYALDIQYEGGDIHPAAWDAFMTRWLMDALRVTAPGGRLALNVPLDTTVGGYRPTYATAVAAAQRVGWKYRTSIIWRDNTITKTTARGSVDSAAAPHIIARVEMVALFSKGEWSRTSESPSDLTREEWINWTDGVWDFRGEISPWEDHPAAFPIRLPHQLVKLLSFPGDVVLDPFAGSGTTLIAAHRLGRRAIGFDRSQTYVDSALRRIAADRGRSDAVHAAGVSEGLRGEGAAEGEPGGLRGGLHRGAGGVGEPLVFQAGAPGVAV